mmetsp:Transcript_4802/g.7134  ORF Transcript_4802/g.7134 Transcript_4802/m.7134 type:complete len:455 (-) Transcript_4802:280-1644(-)
MSEDVKETKMTVDEDVERKDTKQDHKEAAKSFRLAAEQDLAEDQYNLGCSYMRGLGVEQSYEEAKKCFAKAAKQGHAGSQCNLGHLYEKGLGVVKNLEEAKKWYEKAAEQGFATAQCNLGLLCRVGLGVKQSHKEAKKWFEKAAKQGCAQGQHNLGCLYALGLGVERNYGEAKKWYTKAAKQGQAASQCNLGHLHIEFRNYEKAKTYHLMAANQGDATSQYVLGHLHEKKLILDADKKSARSWYKMAATQGEPRAMKAMQRLTWGSKWIKKKGYSISNEEIKTNDDIEKLRHGTVLVCVFNIAGMMETEHWALYDRENKQIIDFGRHRYASHDDSKVDDGDGSIKRGSNYSSNVVLGAGKVQAVNLETFMNHWESHVIKTVKWTCTKMEQIADGAVRKAREETGKEFPYKLLPRAKDSATNCEGMVRKWFVNEHTGSEQADRFRHQVFRSCVLS